MTITRGATHMELVDRNRRLLATATFFSGLTVLSVPILLFAPFQDGRGAFVLATLALAGLSYWMLFRAHHVLRVEIIVNEHHGEIKLESVQNSHTDVLVSLPIHKSDDQGTTKEADEPKSTPN